MLGAAFGATAPPRLALNTLYRQVAGVDEEARPMTAAESAELADPMGSLLRGGNLPMTLPDLLAMLRGTQAENGAGAAGLDVIQNVYLVSESGQIPPDAAPGLHRDIRFAIVCAVRGRDPDLLISTGANADPATTFLQVAAWDEQAGVFNYYMRITPAWIWTGNSWSALTPPSRGNGCFDSHVNGSVVMKELKQPWLNWQSMSATIQLAPDDPLHADPLYRRASGAQLLELTVRGLVSRWTTARLAKVTEGGVVRNPDHLLRQLFTTTTVNLTSTLTESAAITADSENLVLPLGFWLDNDALLDDLGLPVGVAPPAVSPSRYLDSLNTFEFRLEERASGFSRPGDTFFAFVVPEVAHEDNDVVHQLVQKGIISAKFAASVLMVDFTNPVFSPARASLMRYVPTESSPTATLCTGIADAIVTAAARLPAESPERQFAANWTVSDTDWPKYFGQRLDAYLDRVAARLDMVQGFSDYVRLAESRRRDFKAMRLNEFELTLPVTNIATDAVPLRMNEDATVSPRS